MNHKILNTSSVELRTNVFGQEIVLPHGEEVIVAESVLKHVTKIYPSFITSLGQTDLPVTVGAIESEIVKNIGNGNGLSENEDEKKVSPRKSPEDELEADVQPVFIPAPKKKERPSKKLE